MPRPPLREDRQGRKREVRKSERSCFSRIIEERAVGAKSLLDAGQTPFTAFPNRWKASSPTVSSTSPARRVTGTISHCNPHCPLMAVVMAVQGALGLAMVELSMVRLNTPAVFPFFFGLRLDPLWFGIRNVTIAEISVDQRRSCRRWTKPVRDELGPAAGRDQEHLQGRLAALRGRHQAPGDPDRLPRDLALASGPHEPLNPKGRRRVAGCAARAAGTGSGYCSRAAPGAPCG